MWHRKKTKKKNNVCRTITTAFRFRYEGGVFVLSHSLERRVLEHR